MKLIQSDRKLFRKEVTGGLVVKRTISGAGADGEVDLPASQASGTV